MTVLDSLKIKVKLNISGCNLLRVAELLTTYETLPDGRIAFDEGAISEVVEELAKIDIVSGT